MRDEVNKRIVLCLILLIILIIIVIAVLIVIRRENIHNNENVSEFFEDGEDIIQNYGKSEDNKIDQQAYFDINYCIKQYLSITNVNNSIYYGYGDSGEYEKIDDISIKENICKILSKKYIENNNINNDNLYDYIQVREIDSLFVPLEISMVQDTDIKSFLVYGIIESLELKEIDSIFFIVNMDMVNYRFSIYPIYGDYSSIKEIDNIQIDQNIEDNYINEFVQSTANYESIAKDFMNRYKRLSIGKPEVLYQYLNKEYREKRFGDVEQFKLYIKENKNTIMSIQCNKYYVQEHEAYKQFVIQDQYEKIYNFYADSIIDFSIILDTYTIDLPEFIEKYENANEQVKVGMNIEKVMEAINAKDYKYVYDKLDNTFKKNNYKTLSIFEKSIKENLYNNNDIKYLKFAKQGDTYIYNLEIKDKDNLESVSKELNIFMKLEEGTDFVMSFNIK